MGWLDIVLIIAVSVPVLLGFRRGLVKTVAPVAGTVVAVLLALRFYGPLAEQLSAWLDSPTQCKVAAFAIIFILVIVAALLLASLIRRFLSLVLLGWVDNLGGAVLGLAIGALIPAALLTLAVRFYPSGAEDAVRDSSVASFLVDRFANVLTLLPDRMDAVRQFFG